MKRRRFPILSLLCLLALIQGLACASSQKELHAQKEIETEYQMASNYFEHGESAQAIRLLAMVLAKDHTHADANHLMGFIRLGRAQYEEAVKHFQLALASKPKLLSCKNNLAVAYMHLERYEEAAVIFKELSQSPLYTSPWLAFVNLGWAYYQMGMLPEAKTETEMAIFLNPKLCLGFNNLGVIYRDLLRLQDAKNQFREAIEACSHYAEPHLHLALLYSDEGEWQKAQEHFKRCYDLNPKTELGKRCQKHLELLR